MIRFFVRRHGWYATYAVVASGRLVGVTIWRRRRTGNLGAVSVLAPIGHDTVPVQVIFGDWWKAHRRA